MNANVPPDDVDRWLTTYFQSKLPSPFPPAPAVGRTEPARTVAARTTEAGRLTLAASVAALLGLGVYLSYGPNAAPAPAAGPGLLEKSTANGKDIHKMMPSDK